jgi:branched-chain amino acid transport system substrate-binding protein
MKKLIASTAIATIAGFAFAGAALADIKIGASVSATGPAAFLGDPEAKTLEMLVEEINAAGGVNGEKLSWFSMTTAATRTRRAPLPPG